MELQKLMNDLARPDWDWGFDVQDVDPEKVVDSDPWEALSGLDSFSTPDILFQELDVFDIEGAPEVAQKSSGSDSLEASQVLSGDGALVDHRCIGPAAGFSPGSCSGAEGENKVDANSDVDTRSLCSNSSEVRTHSQVKQGSLDLDWSNSLVFGDSYPELKSCSLESGCNSSDEQMQGGSCNNFASQSGDATGSGEDVSGTIDEETKRKIRLMRNRESATQSRLRKKSYVKELEMKCRLLENHCSMLQQTVAFTSKQNVILRDELNKIKSSNVNGSKSGVVEPAALPSDSLPSESPPRLTASGPFRLDNWELLACLYHVLLLTFLETKVHSRGRRGSRERRPWFWIKRCQVLWLSAFFINLVSLGRLSSLRISVTRKLLCFSNRGKRRNDIDIPNVTSLFSTYDHQHQPFSKKRKNVRSGRQRRRRYDDHIHR